KVATRGAMISSGIPGRPVAIVSSPDARWAAAYEVQQYGFHKKLFLFRLEGVPRQYEVRLDGLGFSDEGAFESVRFDSAGDALYVMNKWGQASVVDLAAADAMTAEMWAAALPQSDF